jgi:hypothetical protein
MTGIIFEKISYRSKHRKMLEECADEFPVAKTKTVFVKDGVEFVIYLYDDKARDEWFRKWFFR